MMSSTDNLKVFYHNVGGLTLAKLTNLLYMLNDYKYDVVILVDIKSVETPPVWFKTLEIPRYRLFTIPDLDAVEHGACVYVSEEIRGRQVTEAALVHRDSSLLAYKEAVWVTVDNTMLIGSIWYDEKCSTDELSQTVRDSVTCFPNLTPMLIGNFGTLDEVGKDRSLVDALQLVKYVKHFDCEKSPALLTSLLFLTSQKPIKPFNIICEGGLGDSYHSGVSFYLNFDPVRQQAERKVRMLEKGDYVKMQEELSIDWQRELRGKSTQQAIKIFEQRMLSAIEHHVPEEKIKQSNIKPAWTNRNNERIQRMIKEKNYGFNKKGNNRVGSRYYKRADQFKKCVFQEKERYEKACYNTGDYQYISDYMSPLAVKDETVRDYMIDMEGIVLETDEEIADALSDHFKSLRVTENPVKNPKIEGRSAVVRPLDITTDMILEELYLSKKKPTKGPDRIPHYVLVETAKAIAPALHYIFNESINRNILPDNWKLARIRPKYKNEGDPYVLKFYRPISITSGVCKLLERMIEKHIVTHMNNNGYFSSHAHGYKNNRGVRTNIFETLDACTEALHHGQPVDIIYLDLSKAFDTVPHHKLLICLLDYGIGGNLLHWIANFLVGRQCYVQVRGQYSERCTIDSGVPQGSVLGNLFFALFLNKLPTLIESNMSMYCDDIKIYAALQKDENGEYKSSLQEDLDKLCAWASENQMKFNGEKCKVMHLGSDNPRTTYIVTTDRNLHFLQPVECQRDLGIFVDSKLMFADHIKQRCAEALQKIELMKCQFAYLSLDVFRKIYVSYIRGHLELQSPLWSPSDPMYQNMLENVQRQATSCIKELKDLPYNKRLQQLQLPTLAARRVRADLVQMYRFLNGDDALHVHNHLERSSEPGAHSKALKKRSNLAAVRERFFFERVVEPWNELTEEIVNADTLNDFEKLLDKYMDEQESTFYYENENF